MEEKDGLRGSQVFLLALARQGLMSMVDYLEAFIRSGADEQLDKSTLKHFYNYMGQSRHFDELLFSYTNPGEYVDGDFNTVILDQAIANNADGIGLALMQQANNEHKTDLREVLSARLKLSPEQVHKVLEAARELVQSPNEGKEENG